MKKMTILTAGILSVMLLLAGCSNAEEPFEEKNYTASVDQIEEVHIDVLDRAIEVSLSEDNRIHIDYFENDKEQYDISFSEKGILTMTAITNKEWADYIGGKSASGSRTISLQIPDKLLSTLSLTTTNENIAFSPLTVTGNVSLSTNGGDLKLDTLNAGNAISLTAKNGDIEGSIVGSYDEYMITCEVKKGESNLPSIKDGGAKTLSVVNNNGDITVDFVAESHTMSK